MKNFVKTLKKAFSVPELLVTVGVVGSVSVLVLGVANKEITTQLMNTQRVLTNNEVAVAVADMQAEGKLAGYNSQEAFVKALSNYYDITVIPKDEVESKFAATYTDANGNTFSANNYENKVVTSGGASLAFTYDTTCNPKFQFSQDSSAYQKTGNNYSYLAKNEALSCIKGFYDINGAKGPNEYGKDVMLLSEFTKDCRDENGKITNFIPNAYGNCPNDTNKNKENTLTPAASVCTLTELNCKADGSLKTLDRNACECVCRISCPKGQTLNKEKCTCSCDTNAIEKNICKTGTSENPYADCEASKDACTCMPKNPNAPKLCKENGGEWNAASCRCVCKDATKNNIKSQYNNLAIADENNFCTPKCLYSSKTEAFTEIVKQNAKNNSASETKAAEITNTASIAEKCFKCNSSSSNNIQYIKNDIAGKGGFCTVGCSDSVKNSKEYDTKYFEFIPYDAANPIGSCKWVCKTGANEGIKKYVADLNKQNKSTTPKILNYNDNSTDLANFKLAQYHYFEAAALGKGRDEHTGSYGDDRDYYVKIGGRYFLAQKVYNCEDRGCGATFRAFKDNNSVFAGFLRFAASPNTAPAYAFGWPNDYSADNYKIHYTANTDNCTVETTGFNFGTSPTTQIPYHSAGVDRRKWEMVTFNFHKILNNDGKNVIIQNPNNQIKAPESFKSQGDNNKYSDEYWKNIVIGVKIEYSTQYDPLALNIGSNPLANPEVQTPATVKFPIIRNSFGGYDDVDVHWPKEDGYQFVVNKSFKTNFGGIARNIGNMFSDQVASDGHQYDTGFDQLQTQYDKNKDNIITRDELKDLYIWKKADNKFTPLTDFVLDLNLYKDVVRDESGSGIQNDNIIYDLQGSYRRLEKLGKKPTCEIGKLCIKYIGYDRSALTSDFKDYIKDLEGENHKVELWQDIQNPEVYYYYLREIGGNPSDYPTDSSSWKKITKSDVIESTIANVPEQAKKISTSNIPEQLSQAIGETEGATVTVYQNTENKNIYYVVKETAVENKPANTEPAPKEEPTETVNVPETQNEVEGETAQNDKTEATEPQQEVATQPKETEKVEEKPEEEIKTIKTSTQYELNKYFNSDAEAITGYYFKDGNQWYKVIIAKVTDIIFKYKK